ncbi:hypothetical protein ABEB36_002054 [Hypothenemus hampei]|uniref:Uncharacterized protein n=1 Tax=Hypothenemus hampei TaxID=57062 RepID=A0ABD1F4F3_HYPHA
MEHPYCEGNFRGFSNFLCLVSISVQRNTVRLWITRHGAEGYMRSNLNLVAPFHCRATSVSNLFRDFRECGFSSAGLATYHGQQMLWVSPTCLSVLNMS